MQFSLFQLIEVIICLWRILHLKVSMLGIYTFACLLILVTVGVNYKQVRACEGISLVSKAVSERLCHK